MIIVFIGPFIPPYFIIWMFVFIWVCFLLILLGKKLFKIQKDEIRDPDGMVGSLVFALWLIDAASVWVSGITAIITGLFIPYFYDMYDEWGEYNNVHWFGFILYWAFLYSALLCFCYPVFKRKILEPKKSKKLFILFWVSSVLLLILSLSIYYLFINYKLQ